MDVARRRRRRGQGAETRSLALARHLLRESRPDRHLLSRVLTAILHQVLGAAILLAWNTEIVAGAYFGERLKGSPFERSFANFVALTFTTANLLFLAYANATQAKGNLNHRILWSLLLMIALLIIFVASTLVPSINSK